MHGRAWEPGVTEDAGVSLRYMSPLLALKRSADTELQCRLTEELQT